MESQLIPYILVCILLIGFFAGLEVAFVSANKLNLELRKKQDTFSGRVLARLMENPAEFTGTTLVGVNMLLVIYGLLMMRFTEPLFLRLPETFQGPYVQLLLNIILGALIILVFGEFLPKALFRSRAERMLIFFSLPMVLMYSLLYPLAKVFISVSAFILKYLFNVRVREDRQVLGKVDPDQFTRQSLHGHETESGELNTELFENALSLVNIKVRRCMVPRNEIEALELSASIADVRKKFIDTKLSKIIVYEGSIDNIVGYLHHLDLNRRPSHIRQVLHAIPAVPEAMSAIDLMNRFTKERKSIAWVIDEFGGTAGVVTMEDVLEKIFGDINDEYDVQEHVEKQISANEYIFSGRLELDYLNEKYGFNFPLGGSETLSGYIIAHHETIPKLKERIFIDRYEFDILLVSETRIETVKMKLLGQ
jgi:putative hemolysin